MDLIATPGAATANSYVTLSEAQTFLQAHLSTEAWNTLPPGSTQHLFTVQAIALMQATRLLDAQVRWAGTRATTTQALAWPRQGVVDEDGLLLASTVVPGAIRQATTVYALALLEEAQQASTQAARTGIRAKTMGSTRIEYHESASVPLLASQRLPLTVQWLIRPYGFMPGVAVPLLRT